jgi:tRNA-uridine aminocarboxypropyltransferase
MHGSLCVCSLMPNPRLATRTRVVLLIHRYEDRKPTNTGRLAAECFSNHQIMVRGHEASPTPPFLFDESTEALFLFPLEGARLLAPRGAGSKPVMLIVPDGTWRQASKVRKRVAGLRDVPCVTLPSDVPSIYRLRAEAHEAGLATAEAIARATGILEGDDVRAAVERVFRAMVERTLWARGELATEDVRDGIPDGAMRHDPSSGVMGARVSR